MGAGTLDSLRALGQDRLMFLDHSMLTTALECLEERKAPIGTHFSPILSQFGIRRRGRFAAKTATSVPSAPKPRGNLRHIILPILVMTSAAVAQPNLFEWSATGSLLEARHKACVVSLRDGRVLVAGGEGRDGTLASMEVYTAQGVFEPGAPMAEPRAAHTCSLLPDGRVLAAGGRNGEVPSAGAEIYDPAANRWSPASTQNIPRWGHTASLLSDGRVLLAGGEMPAGATDIIELFDPSTDGFEVLDARLSKPRSGHAAATLADGRVLITGGTADPTGADLFLPAGKLIERTADLPGARSRHSAVTLLSGLVFLAGGNDGEHDLASTLFFDPDRNTWLAGASMSQARSAHAAVLIPNNGNVLLVGGSSEGTPTDLTELYNPIENLIQQVGGLTEARRNIVVAPRGGEGVLLAIGGLGESGPVAVCGTLLAPTVTVARDFVIDPLHVQVSGSNWRAGSPVVKLRLSDNFASSFFVSANSDGAFATGLSTANRRGKQIGLVAEQTLSSGQSLAAFTSFHVGVTTTTTLTVTPASPVLAGSEVTLVAQVRPSPTTGTDGRNLILNGILRFSAGKTVLGDVATSSAGFQRDVNGAGFFTLRTSALPAGSASLSADFIRQGGDSDSSSADRTSYSVTKRTPRVDMSFTPQSARIGDITLLASVVGAQAPRPTGTVRFGETNGFVERVIGLGTLPTAGGVQASTTLPVTEAGQRTFIATYLGDANYDRGSASIQVSVAKALPALNMVGLASSITLTETGLYATNLDFTTGIIVPTGTVSLEVDGQTVASRNLTNAPSPGPGRMYIELSTAIATVGQHGVRFRYSGDSHFEAVTGPSVITNVTKAVSIVSATVPLFSAGAPVSFGVLVTVVGTLVPRPAPTGTAELLVDGIPRQTITLAASPTSLIQTIGTFSPVTLNAGQHTMQVIYSGNGTYNGSSTTFTRDLN